MERSYKRLITAMVMAFVLFVAAVFLPQTAYATQSDAVIGTEPMQVDGIYQIGTADELYWFAHLINSGRTTANAVLTADITVNENLLKDDGSLSEGTFREWDPIGSVNCPYSGTFDGQNFTVSGLYFSNNAVEIIGLFGVIDVATIQNVNVADSYFCGQSMVGGLAGYGESVTVTGCSSQGNTIRAADDNVGGLIGYCYNGAFTACFNTSAVSGGENVGGIAGELIAGSVSHCYNEGSIIADSSAAAGIVGALMDGTVDKCYNVGQVAGGSDAVGSVVGSNKGIVTDCCYLENTAIGDHYYQVGIGEELRDTYGRDEEGITVCLTAEQFSSGAAAYIMGNTSGDSTVFWGQNLDNGKPGQNVPVLGSAKVYGSYVDGCKGIYSNTPYEAQPEPVHNTYINGYCAVCGTQQAAADTDGDGYYEIGNMGQLYDFAWRVNHGENGLNAILTADITVNEGVLNEDGMLAEGEFINWPVIGLYHTPYIGNFDGQSHTVSGLYFNSPTQYGRGNLGMFGLVQEATIENLGVKDSYFYGDISVGGVTGESLDSVISNCWFSGTVVADTGAGGITFIMEGGTMENCCNLGKVISPDDGFSGGITGVASVCTITNCYSAGTVDGGNASNAAGYIYDSTFTNCYYLSDSEIDEQEGTAAKTAAQFASGEVTYLLNGASSEGELTWFQTCDEGYPAFSGKTVYLVTDCKGSAVYSNTNESGQHSYGDDAICDICGSSSGELTPEPAITLKYPTLSFESEVFYNVYFTVEDAEVKVEDLGLLTWYNRPANTAAATYESAEAIIPGAVYNSDADIYMVRSQGVPAKQLGDNMYLRIYAKLSDGTYAYSSVTYYNAKFYANGIFANSQNDNMKALCVAMLNYGAAAQIHFDHNTDSLMNAGLTAEQKALVKNYSADMISSLVIPDGEKTANFKSNGGFSGGYPSVSFEGAFAINYYLTPKQTVEGDITLYCWDLATYNSVTELTEDNAAAKVTMIPTTNSGEYFANYTGIAAKQIDETVFVAGVYTSGGVRYSSPVMCYSLGAYCADQIAGGSETMQAFAKETVVYGHYAKAYFASLNG